MAKASKSAIVAASPVADQFAIDKAAIIAVYSAAVSFDWLSVKALLTTYAGDAKRFEEIKFACWAVSIVLFMAKEHSITLTPAQAMDIATHDANVKGLPLPDTHADAKKSARNAWSYFTMKSGFKSLSARGGKREGAGSNKAKPVAPLATTSDETAPAAPLAVNAPITIKSLVVEPAASLMALADNYATVKAYLVKLQALNAKLFVGDEGSRLMLVHAQVVAILGTLG